MRDWERRPWFIERPFENDVIDKKIAISIEFGHRVILNVVIIKVGQRKHLLSGR